jgi:putative FmdB family regulatory protein
MPAYEYECDSCHHRFERRQSILEPPLTTCPECGGTVRRVLSGGAGILVRGGARHREAGASGCSLGREGSTCCGRAERCEKPPCGDAR